MILGIAVVATLATSVFGTSALAVDVDGYKIINYGGKAWLDRNIGASVSPTSWNDTTQESLGGLFQWGRPADGHQYRNSRTTTDCSTKNAPDHSYFIIGANRSGGYNWRTTSTNCNTDARQTHLWGALGSAYNGVCPTGWRVPSEQDFKELGITSAEDAFNKIKLSTAGNRNYSDGSIQDVGLNGFYWTNGVDGGGASGLNIYSGGTSISPYHRSYGNSVRCVKY